MSRHLVRTTGSCVLLPISGLTWGWVRAGARGWVDASTIKSFKRPISNLLPLPAMASAEKVRTSGLNRKNTSCFRYT